MGRRREKCLKVIRGRETAAGANPKVVQRMLGHASAAMTLDVYADLFESDLDGVAESVGKMWAQQSDRMDTRR